MSLWMLLLWMFSPVWQVQASPALPVPDWTEYRLIAHGMGGIDGKTLTNSYDAFKINYEQGIRVFETDLRLTSDGQSVALHDWTAFLFRARGQDVPDPSDRKPVDWQTFKALKVDKTYAPLDIHDIIELLEQHPDAWIITDTKDVSEQLVKRHFQRIAEAIEQSPLPDVGSRIIPQLYKPEMYDWVESQYAFSSYIYTLYLTNAADEDVLQFVKEKPKIKAVTMPKERISPSLVSALHKLGVKTYTHTVNDLSTYQSVRHKGLDGVYTDFLHPGSLADE